MLGQLDWRQSAFGRRYGFGVTVVGSLRMECEEFRSGSRELVYDPTSGHVLWSWKGSNFDYYNINIRKYGDIYAKIPFSLSR